MLDPSRVPPEWLLYPYRDARGVLVDLLDVATKYGDSGIDERTMSLRTKEMRPYQYERQAALFAFGMGEAFGRRLQYAICESADFDCIVRGTVNGKTWYTPVQLKELPPAEVNPTTSLEAELAKLGKYSGDLTIAMHLNRAERIELDKLRIPKLRVSELWLFGGIEPTGHEWIIYGNALALPRVHRFRYPTEK